MSSTTTFTQTDSTADATHGAKTAAALTDSSGGTASGTIAAIEASYTQATLQNAFADCADQINKLVADHRDLASLVNSLIDALQATREIRAIG